MILFTVISSDKKFKFLSCQPWLYIILAGSECSDETVWMHRLVCAFAVDLCTKLVRAG